MPGIVIPVLHLAPAVRAISAVTALVAVIAAAFWIGSVSDPEAKRHAKAALKHPLDHRK